MQQQFPDAQRVFIEYVALLVRTDVHAVDEYLITLNADEGLLDAAFSHAEGFYFRTCKCNSRLISIQDKIVMIRLFIVRNHLALRFCLSHLLSPLFFPLQV